MSKTGNESGDSTPTCPADGQPCIPEMCCKHADPGSAAAKLLQHGLVKHGVVEDWHGRAKPS